MLAEQIMISPVSLATLPQKERSTRNGTLSRGQEDDMRQSVTCAVSSCVLLMWWQNLIFGPFPQPQNSIKLSTASAADGSSHITYSHHTESQLTMSRSLFDSSSSGGRKDGRLSSWRLWHTVRPRHNSLAGSQLRERSCPSDSRRSSCACAGRPAPAVARRLFRRWPTDRTATLQADVWATSRY